MDLSKVYIEPAERKEPKKKLLSIINRNNILFLLLSLFSIGLSVFIREEEPTYGVIILLLLVATPILILAITYPSVSVITLLLLAYFIMLMIRLNFVSGFPLGTLMDGFETLILITFFWHQRFRPNWDFMSWPVSILILVWLAYCFAMVANPAASSRLAWVYTYRTMALVIAMYFPFVYFINSIQLIRIVIITCLILALVAAIYGLKQEYIGFAKFEEDSISDPLAYALLYIDGHWRKFSIFNDPVVFSYMMVASAMLCFVLMWATKKIWQKVVLLTIGLFFLRVMLFSGTRSAYVMIPAGLAFYFLLTFNRKMLPMVIIAAIGLLILIRIPTSNPALYRFQTAFTPSTDASFNVRQQNQQRIKPYIWSHPIGGGLGASGASGVRFSPGSYLASFPPDSGYARLAVETGWVGLLIFCILVFAALVAGINNFFRIKNKELKAYCLAMLLTVFVLNVGNYPQEAIVQFPSNLYFFLAIAIMHVTYRIDKREEEKLSGAGEQITAKR